jgi:hypothetical protein
VLGLESVELLELIKLDASVPLMEPLDYYYCLLVDDTLPLTVEPGAVLFLYPIFPLDDVELSPPGAPSSAGFSFPLIVQSNG